MRFYYWLYLVLMIGSLVSPAYCDWRNIINGHEIPTKNYADQPYIVKTDDGAWLCILTTGVGHEGEAGQHVISLRSTDQGHTWSEPVAIEPGNGPEASYAVPLKVPSGRIYVFYNHNTDNMRKVIADNPPFSDGFCYRVDSLGYFVFKYSDDHGRSWSTQRYPIPVREFEIDRNNPYQGKIRFFWNVGKAFQHNCKGYVPLHKVGGFGQNFFTSNEGVLLKSENLLTETDPAKITWQTLPDGDVGLRTPPGGGPISAEQSFSILSDGSFYCVYRSIDGHPVFTYSRDGGHSWDTPQYKRYADGRLIKHPRAANFAWRCENGKYLYWFHNHGGRSYTDRNPVWLSGGIEVDSDQGKIIQWSQPEIVLYDDNPAVRISYPDLIEDQGKYFLTETQKSIARIHEIDSDLLKALWNQFDEKQTPPHDASLQVLDSTPQRVEMPRLPNLESGNANHDLGFSIDFWIQFDSLKANQIIFDNRQQNGKGLCIQTSSQQTVEIILNDGRTENRWRCDPDMLQVGQLHHVGITIDGAAKIITFVIDGKVNDGGIHRQFGWGRFSPYLGDLNGKTIATLSPNLTGKLKQFRIYERLLLHSEIIAQYKSLQEQ